MVIEVLPSRMTPLSRQPPHKTFRTVGKHAKISPASVPSQVDMFVRTKSFNNWKKRKGIKISDLVNSGFSYLGISDRVQCFQCGEIFEHWRDDEDVDSEHSRLSPTCTFIQTKLRKCVESYAPTYQTNEFNVTVAEMRRHTQDKLLNLLTSYAYSSQASNTSGRHYLDYSKCVDVPANMTNTPHHQFPVAPRDIRARLDTAASRRLLDMGFKKPLLAQVIGERLSETGDDFCSFMEYFIAVKQAEQIVGGGNVDTLKMFYDNSIKRLSSPAYIIPPEPTTVKMALAPDLDNHTCSLSSSQSNGLPKQDITKGILKQNITMTVSSSSPQFEGAPKGDISFKRKKECIVCMDMESDTVFMPCRHMCACIECGNKLTTCPICRKEIECVIKVYV